MSTEHIARISYGKDSLKMLDVIKSRGLPLDRITTTDVWATDTISANLPPMDAFKERMDQWIWDNYRIEVEHLCARNPDGSKRTYEQMFYHVPQRRSQIVQVERERAGSASECREGSRFLDSLGVSSSKSAYRIQGTIKGFPGTVGVNWCTKLKTQWVPSNNIPMVQKAQDRQGQNPFFDSPAQRAKRNTVEYIGIAADEPKRFGQLNDRKIAPLVLFDIEEGLCGLHCQYNDILSPSYETSFRDGCWFCHNQGVNQLRLLRRNYPNLWELLMKWDLDSPVSFKADGHTVHDFDRRFQMEELALVPMDKTFRWKMLDDPPKLRPWEYTQLSLFEQR